MSKRSSHTDRQQWRCASSAERARSRCGYPVGLGDERPAHATAVKNAVGMLWAALGHAAGGFGATRWGVARPPTANWRRHAAASPDAPPSAPALRDSAWAARGQLSPAPTHTLDAASRGSSPQGDPWPGSSGVVRRQPANGATITSHIAQRVSWIRPLGPRWLRAYPQRGIALAPPRRLRLHEPRRSRDLPSPACRDAPRGSLNGEPCFLLPESGGVPAMYQPSVRPLQPSADRSFIEHSPFSNIQVGERAFFDDIAQRWPAAARPNPLGLGHTKYLELPQNSHTLPGVLFVVTTRDLSTDTRHYGYYINTPIEGSIILRTELLTPRMLIGCHQLPCRY